MNKAYLLLGSNLGDRLEHLNNALKIIQEDIGAIVKSSPVYETEPWGLHDQPYFLNQAILVETLKSPVDLLEYLKHIEKKLKREHFEKWGARSIDIDILFYNDEIINSDLLTVPHPFFHKRNFSLIPLNKIAPDLHHPVLKKQVRQLLQESNDELSVELFAEKSELRS